MKEIHMSTNDDTNATLLTPEQIAFFKDNGYLLLSGAMDPDLCAKARDRLWAALPPDVAVRRDESTDARRPLCRSRYQHRPSPLA